MDERTFKDVFKPFHSITQTLCPIFILWVGWILLNLKRLVNEGLIKKRDAVPSPLPTGRQASPLPIETVS
jgi:hypothetical protein